MKKFISFFAVMPIAAMLLTACNNDPLGQDLIDIRNGNYRYWGKDPDVVFDKEDTRSWHLFPQCKGARFEGKEIEVKQVVVDSTGYRDYNGYFIDIVLER